jgi:Pyruvate/2-oxoacid:ferredoxin oxidoreductase delta subunit
MTGGATPRGRQAASVIGTACQGCGGCLLTCPEHAIRPAWGTFSPLAVLATHCTGCGDCAEICPAEAIVIQEVL